MRCFMKKFLRRNVVVIVILVVFGAIFLYGDYQVIKNNQGIAETRNNYIERCKTKKLQMKEKRNFVMKYLRMK